MNNVYHKFGNLSVLSNINLTINAGEKVGLIGASGAGKSTLLNLLNGTISPTQGKIEIFGKNIAQLSPKKLRQIQQKIGTVYQQFNLVDNLRVIHNINVGHLGRWSFLKAAFSLIFPLEIATAKQALTQVGIADKIYEKTENLSGGQKQRVALARVIVQNPLVILADEPISNLDPEFSREIMNLLTNMCDQNGKTLVVSLHDLEFAKIYCDRLIGLRKGSILFDLPTTKVTSAMIEQLYELENRE